MNYFAVGATFGSNDMSPEFLKTGRWYDGWAEDGDDKDREYLDEVKIGDILLMKSSSTKGTGHSISFTKLKGIGKVIDKNDYYDFKVKWYVVPELPLDFDGIWYAKTIEYMREDDMLNYAKKLIMKAEPNDYDDTELSVKMQDIWNGIDKQTSQLAIVSMHFEEDDLHLPKHFENSYLLLKDLDSEIQNIADKIFGSGIAKISCNTIREGSLTVILTISIPLGVWKFFKDYKGVRDGVLAFTHDVRTVKNRLFEIIHSYLNS